MTGWLEAAGCVISLVHVDVSRPDDRWTERVHLRLSGSCAEVVWTVAPEQELTVLGGTITPAAGPSHPAAAVRLTAREILPDGAARLAFHLEDLAGGGQADIRFKRRSRTPDGIDLGWPGPEVTFFEAHVPAAFPVDARGLRQQGRFWYGDEAGGSLRVGVTIADPGAQAAPPGELPPDEAWAALRDLRWLDRTFDGALALVGEAAARRGAVDDRGYARTLAAMTARGPDPARVARWSPSPDTPPAPDAPEVPVAGPPGALYALPHPAQALPAGALHTGDGVLAWDGAPGEAPAPPQVRWTVTADPGPGDPRAALARGRGLVHVEAALIGSGAIAATLVLPQDAERVDVRSVVDGAPAPPDTLRRAGRRLWVIARPGAERVEIAWDEPLRDVWGALPPPPTLNGAPCPVAPPEAGLPQDGDGSWRLAELAGPGGPIPLLTTRDRLLRELDERLRVAAYPAPAAPARLRRLPVDAALLEAARAALPERFAIAALDLPPDRPRHLLHARRSGVVTELEAAAILRGWLDQLDVPAEIRLMCDGPAPAVTPIGCAHAVLEVTLDGAPLTLDPACPTCPPGAQREGLTPL